MDDIGMSCASNGAAKQLFKRGIATSASVMIPCHWAYDFIKWHKENPSYDVGLHFTLNCEWERSRWRPLSSYEEAESLFDEEGFMHKRVEEEFKSIPVSIIELEMNRQVELAKRWGLSPSHIDSHMWYATAKEDYMEAYLKMAKKMMVVPHIPEWSLWNEERKRIVKKSGFCSVNNSVSIGDHENYEQKKEAFLTALENLNPGLNVYTVHPVINTPEIREIIPEWKNRYNEYKLLLDDDIEKAIRYFDIKLVSWGS